MHRTRPDVSSAVFPVKSIRFHDSTVTLSPLLRADDVAFVAILSRLCRQISSLMQRKSCVPVVRGCGRSPRWVLRGTFLPVSAADREKVTRARLVFTELFDLFGLSQRH